MLPEIKLPGSLLLAVYNRSTGRLDNNIADVSFLHECPLCPCKLTQRESPGQQRPQQALLDQADDGAGWPDGYLEPFFLRFFCLSSSFPLQVNNELILSLRQSGGLAHMGLTGY